MKWWTCAVSTIGLAVAIAAGCSGGKQPTQKYDSSNAPKPETTRDTGTMKDYQGSGGGTRPAGTKDESAAPKGAGQTEEAAPEQGEKSEGAAPKEGEKTEDAPKNQ